MYWLAASLFLIGAICGATVRLMVFVVVLIGAAAVAIAAGLEHGLGTALVDGVIAVFALQVGYAAGFVLRAVIRSRRTSSAQRVAPERRVHEPLGEKRR
jgi:hypothetical protein